jgi:hypothetical protein
LAGFVLEEDTERLEVVRRTVAEVVVDQKVVNGVAAVRDVLVDDEACWVHASRIALRNE